jgi:hypothetical protein
MTGSLPSDVQAVFDRFLTSELTTVDRRGQPITWPLTPYYTPGGRHISVTTGLGYPKKADDAAANPKVSLLFSDPTGSGLTDAPMVLVQGTAEVDDRDLAANRERYVRESVEKLPGIKKLLPPKAIRGYLDWYFTRIYVHVRPERVYVWPGGDATRVPELYDTRLEEVRSGHSEEPEAPHERPEGGVPAWHPRIEELGTRYPTAVISLVAPDGFPFSVRVPVNVDEPARCVRLLAEPEGVPLQPGLGCLVAHRHDQTFTTQSNFQVRGDVEQDEHGWRIVPHKLVGGFELPPGRIAAIRANLGKARRFRAKAKTEHAKRSARG